MNHSCIIISVYCNDTLLIVQEMFNSLFEQTITDFDILVQQDGMIDPEVEHYLDTLHSTGKVFKLSKRDENRGLAYSLNELITQALEIEYQYIFRMDADDICLPYRIEHQLKYLSEHPEVDILGGWIEEFNTDTNVTQTIYYPEKHDDILKHMLQRNPIAHVTIAFRASFFKKYGKYDAQSSNEDFRLWVDTFKAGATFHNLQEVLVNVRTNNAFYSRRKNKQRALEVMHIKFEATHLFGFGIKGYFYAIAHYLLFMSPSLVKQFIYKFFR